MSFTASLVDDWHHFGPNVVLLYSVPWGDNGQKSPLNSKVGGGTCFHITEASLRPNERIGGTSKVCFPLSFYTTHIKVKFENSRFTFFLAVRLASVCPCMCLNRFLENLPLPRLGLQPAAPGGAAGKGGLAGGSPCLGNTRDAAGYVPAHR